MLAMLVWGNLWGALLAILVWGNVLGTVVCHLSLGKCDGNLHVPSEFKEVCVRVPVRECVFAILVWGEGLDTCFAILVWGSVLGTLVCHHSLGKLVGRMWLPS